MQRELEDKYKIAQGNPGAVTSNRPFFLGIGGWDSSCNIIPMSKPGKQGLRKSQGRCRSNKLLDNFSELGQKPKAPSCLGLGA